MKSMNSKGQAALEFMMTYGWAILVVLAAIGALSYFGVLNPAKLTPDTCLSSTGFACPGKPIINETSIIFTLINGLGYTAELDGNEATLSSTLGTTGACDVADILFCNQGVSDPDDVSCVTTRDIEDGAGTTVILQDCNFSELNLVKGEVKFVYRNPMSMLNEEVTVSLNGKINR